MTVGFGNFRHLKRLTLPIRFGRRSGIILALVTVSVGSALNWSWLTAIGAAPIILSVAPCAIMCALGLCMKGSGKCAAGNGNQSPQTDVKPVEQQNLTQGTKG